MVGKQREKFASLSDMENVPAKVLINYLGI
jgi:hypothetical protein